MVARLLSVLAALALVGCGDPCEDGSMLDSPGGLVVIEAEHPDGWGRADCADCHSFAALHRDGCAEEVDYEALRDEVDADGADSCGSCHGENGVEQ